MSISFEFILC